MGVRGILSPLLGRLFSTLTVKKMETIKKLIWIFLICSTSSCGLIGNEEDLSPNTDEVVLNAEMISTIPDVGTDRD